MLSVLVRKNVVKWPIIPITIGQGPISRLCPIFDDGQKENEMQKNKAKKKGRKRAGNLERQLPKKGPNFGFCSCRPRLQYCTFLYLLLGKSILLV